MAPLNYRLLLNSFEIQTAKSNAKATILTTDTVDKLRPTTDPALQNIYTLFLPFYDAYMDLNQAVEMADGTYKGKTATFETILNDMPKKLRIWEGGIHAVFPEDSPEDLDIFPRKRSPFYEGAYDLRIGSLKVLRDKLLDYTPGNPSLVPVQANVAAYYTLLKTAREVQQGKEGADGNLHSDREAQRVLTMNAYWGIVYGGLLGLYYNTPEKIGQYIDFGLLYDHKNEDLIDTVSVPIGQSVTNVPLADVAVVPTTQFRLKNLSSTAGVVVMVYFAINGTIEPDSPPQGLVINPGDNRLATAAELGYLPGKGFLNIFNPGGNPGLDVEIWEVS